CERMRLGRLDRLSGQNMDGLRVLGCQRVVGEMQMEVEGGDPGEPAAGIQVRHSGQGSNLLGPLDHRWTETIVIFNGYSEFLHQGTSVRAGTVLARNHSVAVGGVLHVTHLQIVCRPNVVMWSKDQTRSFAREKL